jgi:hypothetical protein
MHAEAPAKSQFDWRHEAEGEGDGKLLNDLPWNQNVSRFVDVIEAVIAYIEAAHRSSAEAS